MVVPKNKVDNEYKQIVVYSHKNKIAMAYIINDIATIKMSICDDAHYDDNNKEKICQFALVCELGDLITGLEYISCLTGPYSIRLTNATVALFARGKDGFSIPRTITKQNNGDDKWQR